MRHLISALCALALLASFPALASAAPVVYCGVVKANSITSGQGSGPRTYELDVTSGPGGGGRFGVPNSIPTLPTIGSYICGQFEQGAPMNSLVAYVAQGDAGYVAQAGAAPAAPAVNVLQPTAVQPATVAQTDPGLSAQAQVSLLLIAVATLAVLVFLIARSRRMTAAARRSHESL